MKNNTINKKEIEKFSKIAEEWWNPEGKFKPLHKFNPIRISYIKENIIKTFKINQKKSPLKNIKILDIGCGGGLLSEPMCRLGAEVTAIDASEKNISVAKIHSKKNNLKINYICTSPEKLGKLYLKNSETIFRDSPSSSLIRRLIFPTKETDSNFTAFESTAILLERGENILLLIVS